MRLTLKLILILGLYINSYGNYSYDKLLDTCISHIKKYEGFRNEVYHDDLGNKFIGYGHLLRKGEDYTKITKAFGEKLLRKDFKRTMDFVKKESSLKGNKLLAMTLFSYNCGVGIYMTSSVCRAVKACKPIDKYILQYGYYYTKGGVAVKSDKLLERRRFELWLYNL